MTRSVNFIVDNLELPEQGVFDSPDYKEHTVPLDQSPSLTLIETSKYTEKL